jgi:2,4-diketo-3-deoxy-L-fuconate hydrolase
MTTFHSATGLALGSFGIGTFRAVAGKPFPALVKPDGTVYDLSATYHDTHAILDNWDRALDQFQTLAEQGGLAELRYEELEARPVVSHPNMMCAGSNYRQHVAEMMTYNKFNQDKRLPGESDESFFARNLADVDRRAREGMPFFWTGLHSSLAGANDVVTLPLVGEHPDWELEFGVILCGTGRYLKPDETENIIAGYVMVNDLGTVDEFRRSDVRWGHDWVSKHQPGFKPCGPFMVPKEFVDRSQVRIKLQVNGKAMQDWPISDMIFPPEKILSYASERIRMTPGDLLITGSPPGNGAMMGQFLAPGDVIESEITYLGRQRNEVVAEETGGRAPTWGPFPIWEG